MGPRADSDWKRSLTVRGPIGPRWVAQTLSYLSVLLLVLIGAGQVANAQNIIERLVNPGPLADVHAKLEATCNSCHTPFTRATQNALCLDCHKPVNADVAAHTGFHGRNREIERSQCRRCHTDHKGRDAPIVFLDRPLFDHTQTDFPLTGAHIGVACESCHAAGKPFREAKSGCADCHADDDVHKGRLGAQCADCHVTVIWSKITRFDHNKTKFPLLGQHAKADCRSCHAGDQLVGLPVTCIGCHKQDDVHKGKFGTACQDCHKNDSWRNVKFDHDTTQFPLRGAHAKIACDTCHKGGDFKAKLPLTCIGCHKKDDVHKGGFGDKCEGCHTVVTWKDVAKFDHDKTRFPLVGRHKPVPCADCHKDKDFKNTPMQCQACHKDVFHKGRLGPECGACHSPLSWLKSSFDHAKTRFPLTGRHVGLDCHACHSKPVTGPPVLSTVCGTCHKKDDVHRGSLGQNCGRCHSTRGF